MPSTFGAELRLLQGLSGISTYFPSYHAVADYDLPHIKHLLTTRNVREFKDDIDFFLTHFTPVSLADILDDLNGTRPLPRNAMLLTIDDGMREVHDVMAPILQQKGCPAVFYLCPPFLDNQELFWRSKCSLLIEAVAGGVSDASAAQISEILASHGINVGNDELVSGLRAVLFRQREIFERIATVLDISFDEFLRDTKPFMTAEQVDSLIKQGFDVGAHSMNHPDFSKLTEEEAFKEANDSIEWVAERFGNNYRSFAHPFRNNGLPRRQIQRLLDEAQCPVIFGTAGSKIDFDRRIIQRNDIEDDRRRPAAEIVRSFLRRCVIRRAARKQFVERAA